MPLIPLFKKQTIEELSNEFNLSFPSPDWVSIDLELSQVKDLDPELGALGLDEDEFIEYETNRYDATHDNTATGETLSVYIYMNEDSNQVIAIDDTVLSNRTNEKRLAADTLVGAMTQTLQERKQ